MRIVSWNMGAFTPSLRASATRSQAWELLSDLDPAADIALLQEATIAPDAPPDGGGSVGSRIWAPSTSLAYPRTLDDVDQHGRVAITELTTEIGDVALISFHAKTEGSVVEHVEALLDRLSAEMSGPFVLAGDFNSCRAAEVIWPGYRHLEFFETAGDRWGMVDCHWQQHGQEKRTYFKNCRDEGQPFQDDHIFVSLDLSDRVDECEVLDYEPFRGISDHAPIAVELNFDA